MHGLTRPILFCAFVLGSGLAPAQSPAEPTFVAGELGALQCKVTDREDIDEWATLLTVEVTNRGDVDAEPLTFTLAWTDRATRKQHEQVLERARLPHVARFGRPTPAKGKQRYRLRAGGLPKRARATVVVKAATFHRGGAVPAPNLRIGPIEQVQRTSLTGTYPVSKVPLHNPFDRAVEVLLAVRLVQPRDCDELYGVRLEAGRTLDWIITTRPGGGSVFLAPEIPPGCAMKATRIEVVDWCLVGEPDSAGGSSLLREPYERWYRWDDGTTVTGEFTYRGQRKRPTTVQGEDPGYDEFAASGRFSVGRDGTARVEVAEGRDGGAVHLLRAAFAMLYRPDFAGLERENRLVLVAPGRVGILGPGWDPTRSRARNLSTSGGDERADLAPFLTVAMDRVTGDDFSRWKSRAFGGHYVVTRSEGSSRVATWSWGELGGRLVPNAFASTTTFGEALFETEEITLSALAFGGEPLPPPPPPAGDGTAALRAIWEQGFRLTTEPITIEAAFEVTNPGTDLVWQRKTRLRGTVIMRGIGPTLRAARFTYDPPLDASMEIALAAAIRDRWLIWYPRDYNARLPFDRYFRGATIHAADPAGDFRVEGHRIARVGTRKGVVVAFDFRGGGRTTFKRTKIKDRSVVTRIVEQIGGGRGSTAWTATTTIGWQQVDGHLLPVSFTFERIFGKDWGPEKIVLREVTVRD